LERRRNDARRRLRRAIEQARRCEEVEGRRRALLEWQHAAITLLGLEAAPTAPQLRRRRGIDPSWTELWEQTEQALYRRDADVDPSWFGRATRLAASLSPSRLPWRRQKLVPATAATALVLALAAVARASETPPQEPVAPAVAPDDWVGRYNRGLAHERGGDVARALGETTSAFLHQPGNSSVRWNLEVLAARVPGADETVARFAHVVAGSDAQDGESALGRATVSIASLLSPANWQAVAIFGAALLAFGAGLRLLQAYGLGRVPARLWISLLVVGATATAAGFGGVRSYGHLADPEAAMLAEAAVLRQLPTEAESGEGEAALAPGSVVLQGEREFLGWTKVAVGGAQGWVRSGQLVPFYGSSES
jgi:hypothetical protein